MDFIHPNPNPNRIVAYNFFTSNPTNSIYLAFFHDCDFTVRLNVMLSSLLSKENDNAYDSIMFPDRNSLHKTFPLSKKQNNLLQTLWTLDAACGWPNPLLSQLHVDSHKE